MHGVSLFIKEHVLGMIKTTTLWFTAHKCDLGMMPNKYPVPLEKERQKKIEQKMLSVCANDLQIYYNRIIIFLGVTICTMI